MDKPFQGRIRTTRYPQRKKLPHTPPWWVPDDSRWFITINCKPPGKPQLCGNTIPENLTKSVLDAARYYQRMDERRWFIHLLLLMPDHLHAVLSFPPDGSMRKTIRAWKGYVRKKMGIIWQSDFFDHRLRNEKEYSEKMSYISMNPVSKGLCAEPENWPHFVAFDPYSGKEQTRER